MQLRDTALLHELERKLLLSEVTTSNNHLRCTVSAEVGNPRFPDQLEF